MPASERRAVRARREAELALSRLGGEIRQARLEHDLSQASAARGAGLAASSWSRLERATAPGLSVVDLARAAASVGLALRLQLYPSGEPVRDAPQLALLERLHVRLPTSLPWATEVPLPNAGDLRAWDAMVRPENVRAGVEAETRGRDSQALQRKLALKRRDGMVDHVVLLMADTRHNRSFLRSVGAGFLAEFPIPGRVALERLMAGRDPRGSSIILL